MAVSLCKLMVSMSALLSRRASRHLAYPLVAARCSGVYLGKGGREGREGGREGGRGGERIKYETPSTLSYSGIRLKNHKHTPGANQQGMK